MRTRPGEIYSAGVVEKTVEDAGIGLAKNGAPFASVLVRSDRVPQSRVINLTYTVEAGKHFYVERIDIHGNSKTRDDVIRREFDFVEGDAYNRALIDRGERRLKQLGYFKTVKIATHAGIRPGPGGRRRYRRRAEDRKFLDHPAALPQPTGPSPSRPASANETFSAPAISPKPR